MKITPWSASFLCCLLISLLAGCGKNDRIAGVANSGSPPTDEECAAYGQALEAAVVAGDVAQVAKIYSLEGMMERMLIERDESEAFRLGFMKGFRSTGGNLRFAQQLVSTVAGGGEFKFLRVLKRDGQPRIIMLQLEANGERNYHEIYPVCGADGKVGAADVYLVSTGETITQTIGRLTPELSSDTDQAELLSFIKDVQQKNTAQAMRKYRSFSPALRNNKAILLMAIASHTDGIGSDYVQLIQEFRDHYPNDPAIDLQSIDFHFLRKEYDQLLACIDRVDAHVGGDPSLANLRIIALIEAGRFADARITIEKALQLSPADAKFHWSRISISLKEQNHSDTRDWLKSVVEKCDVTIAEQGIRQGDYTEFGKSPECQEFIDWLHARQTKGRQDRKPKMD